MTELMTIDQNQKQLIKDTFCKGATDDEFSLFIKLCERTGLDPFQKQIYAIKRFDPSLNRETMTYQLSVDAFRIIAERSKDYGGQLPTEWYDPQKKEWLDVWIESYAPSAARVGIIRKGFDNPVWGIASYNSYVQKNKQGKPNHFWAKMPDLMLAKCAEVSALKRAFPNDLSGYSTSDSNIGESESIRVESTTVSTETKPMELPPELKIREHEKFDKLVAVIETYKLHDKLPHALGTTLWRNKPISEFDSVAAKVKELASEK